jgi:hypothetical protein
MNKMPSTFQKTDTMTFPADGTDLVFFGAEQTGFCPLF